MAELVKAGHMTSIELASMDGTRLSATLVDPSRPGRGSCVLVHGISSDKSEGGLYDELASSLAEIGLSVLSLDLRGHGSSEGAQNEFSLSGAANDIVAALSFMKDRMPKSPASLVGASFGGGVCMHVGQHLADLQCLVLLNPRTNYRPWIEGSSLFADGRVSEAGQRSLRSRGYVERAGFKIGRALANELATWTPMLAPRAAATPVMVLHGDRDSAIPIDETRRFFAPSDDTEFVVIDGAEHGFVDPDAHDVHSPESLALRGRVVGLVVDHIARNHP